MKTLSTVYLLAFALFFASGCKVDQNSSPSVKESGITGSEWYYPVSDKANNWEVLGTVTGGKYYRTDFNAPDISSEVISNSVVLVYAKFSGYDISAWEPGSVGLLPKTVFTSMFGNSTDEWSTGVSVGKISIRLQNSEFMYPTAGPDRNHSFRYIIIPKGSARVTGQKPNTPNPLSRYSESDLRNMSYDEICRQSGLPK